MLLVLLVELLRGKQFGDIFVGDLFTLFGVQEYIQNLGELVLG